MNRVGVIQPNYIPWRGYFYFIHEVDIFIFHDDIQYTKQDWRNRNKVRTLSGDLVWLSVPVRAKKDTLIMDVEIDYSSGWVRKHLAILEQSYSKAPFFREHFMPFKELLEKKIPLLSDLNIEICYLVCDWLGIKTTLIKSSTLSCSGKKDEKLISMLRKVDGTHYLSGPAAKNYIQPHLWQEAGIGLEYISYPDYPAYPQINPGFEPQVSILDLLFMTGPDAPRYIWPTRFS